MAVLGDANIIAKAFAALCGGWSQDLWNFWLISW
jgi:hypothetical protein